MEKVGFSVQTCKTRSASAMVESIVLVPVRAIEMFFLFLNHHSEWPREVMAVATTIKSSPQAISRVHQLIG